LAARVGPARIRLKVAGHDSLFAPHVIRKASQPPETRPESEGGNKEARMVGGGQWSFALTSAVLWLFLAEFATLRSNTRG